MLLRPNEWKSLRSRYEEDRPRRVLALDGGGIRGLITLGILSQIEELIHQKTGKKLCDYFDYIAGTSTGAIIAAGLSLGMTTAELVDFYKSCGEEMFEPSKLLQRLKCLYTADPLRAKLQSVFGEKTTLVAPDSPDDKGLKCLLLVVTKNVTTDSPWPISSNPDAKYNDPARDKDNRKIPLWQLVRACASPKLHPGAK
jgi:predicted acylesterase/phospholipase RssA